MSDSDGKYQWNPGGGGQASDLSSGLKAADTFQPTPVGTPCVACKNVHWISVKLVRRPDVQARPKWWPTPPNIPLWLTTLQNLPYGGETYSADLTSGKKTGSLNGDGVVRFDNIPAGKCQINITQFYEDIEQFFKYKLGK